MSDKSDIRKKVKLLKSSLTIEQKIHDANKVNLCIEELPCFKKSNKILTYHSLPDEIDTTQFLKKWCEKKIIYLPRVKGEQLDVIKYTPTSIQPGAFNILEPTGNSISINEIDIIIVPGIAFDRNGSRIGRGKGFYDRLLCNSNSIKIGIGYDFQLYDNIITEQHDIPMDIIITPNNTIIINNTNKAWL